VAKARSAGFDLAVLDVKMPGLDGFEACRRIKSHEDTRHIPVLMLSATFLETDAHVEGLDTGADGYLTQPVEAPVLAATVRSLLRTRRAEAGVRTAALQWRTTFDAISDAVAVVDDDLVVQRANRAFAHLFGSDPSALHGRAMVTVSPTLHDALREGEAHPELELEGRTLQVRRDAIPSEPDLGLSGQFVVTLSDVTAARRAEQERAAALERERTISSTLQQSLLPERLPRHPRLRLDAWHLAAEKELIVGGDWYDVIEVDGGVWLVIGDVAGHGVAAAAQAGQLRHSLRVYAHEGFGLCDAMHRLNELVLGTQLTGMATVCIAALDHDSDTLHLIRAGHPPPLLVPHDGPPTLVEGRPGVVLGVPGARCQEHEMALMPGDRLVLYTDGLVERPRESLDEGFQRLLDSAAGLDGLEQLRGGLVSRMVDIDALRDDVALLLAERR
jgi:serine phosphatase RsbU (regulator of sigma subunit)/FixJ family two-component response regulator